MTLANLRTLYNGPDRTTLLAVRVDELQVGDLISGTVRGVPVYGQVDRITPAGTDRLRIRLVDDLDGRHHGESTYPADKEFRVGRLTHAGRTS